MTVEELYNKIKDMELEDECRDFGGLIDIRFAGGQTAEFARSDL